MAIFTKPSFCGKSATLALLLAGLAAPPAQAAPQLPAESAVQLWLQQQLAQAGLNTASIRLQLIPPRGYQPRACPQALQAGSDDRVASRMRVQLSCASQGWREDFIVRADIRAKVAVAARDLPAGSALTADDVVWEQRVVSDPAEMLGSNAAIAGLSNRSALARGQVLRRKQLQATQLVKRGGEVRIVARAAGVEVSAAGEALANGRLDEIIRVRNVNTGKVLRARVSQAGEVNPLE